MRRWWPVLVLAIAPLWPLWRAVFLGEAIGPWDHFRAMPPWNGPVPQTPWNVLQADAVLQFAPWRHMVFDAWSRGEMPFWNPHQLMGTPLLANSQSAGFYPPHILLGLLRAPLYPAITLLAWFHLFWAGLGLYVLCRRIGASRTGSVIGGLSFSLSGFMMAWTPLASVISTVSWLPWCLAFLVSLFHYPLALYRIDGALQRFDLNRSMRWDIEDRTGRVKSLLGLTVCVAMMILSGHVQFLAYSLMAMALVALVLGIRYLNFPSGTNVIGMRLQKDGTGAKEEGEAPLFMRLYLSSGICGLKHFIIALGLGACLAAPQFLPVLDFGEHSHRRQPPGEAGYQSYLSGAVSLYQAPGIAFPGTLGHPAQMSETLPGANSYWPALTKPGADYAEAALTIGPLALVCLAFLRRKDLSNPIAIAVGSVGVLGLLIALGTPFNRLLYFAVPGWSATGSPGRASVLIVLAACVLLGLGASNMLEIPTGRIRSRRLGAGLGIGLLSLVWSAYNRPSDDPYGLQNLLPSAQASALSQALPWTLAATALAVAFGLAFAKGKGQAFGLALAALMPPVLFQGISPVLTGVPIPKSSSGTLQRLAFVNQGWELVLPRATAYPPNVASLTGLNDVAGYDSLLDRETKALLDAANGRDSAPPTNGNMMVLKPGANWEALANLGVSQVWSAQPVPGMPLASVSGDRLYRYAIGGPGRLTTRVGPGDVFLDGYDRTAVKAYGPGWVVLRDRMMDGWTVRIDGKPAKLVASGPFRSVLVNAGEHMVVFHYWPPGLTLGLKLFALGGFALALILLNLLVLKRRFARFASV